MGPPNSPMIVAFGKPPPIRRKDVINHPNKMTFNIDGLSIKIIGNMAHIFLIRYRVRPNNVKEMDSTEVDEEIMAEAVLPMTAWNDMILKLSGAIQQTQIDHIDGDKGDGGER